MNQISFLDEPKTEFRAGIQPRDYQQRSIDKAFELWDSGVLGALSRQPTGTGKTVSGTLIADRWVQLSDRNRALVIAHERQLVTQFAEEIEGILGEAPGIEMGQEHKIFPGQIPPIVVASRATLYEKDAGDGQKASRLYKFDPLQYNWLVIFDEAHRYAMKLKSVRHIVEWFERNPRSRRLGLTATPERSDKTSLARLFPGVASDYRLYDLDGGECAVNDGWAVPYDQRFVTVEAVNFKNLREVKGDFDENELSAILTERETLLKLVKPTLDLVGARRTIVFNPTVSMAKAVARTINGELGDSSIAVALDGSVPDDARRDVYRRHQSGQFQFLSVCELCREGYNDPGIQAVACFRPTKSRALAEQMKGRGCRTMRGVVDGLDTPAERIAAIAASEKPNCMIVDLVGLTGMADCASTAHILAEGKPDEVVERANKNAIAKDGPVNMADEIKQAERELQHEREQREWRETQRKAKLSAEVQYSQRRVDPGHGGCVATKSARGARMLYGKHKGEAISTISTGYLKTLIEKAPPREAWLKSAIEQELKHRQAGGVKKPAAPTIDEINKMLNGWG